MSSNPNHYGKLWGGGCLFKGIKFRILMLIFSVFWIEIGIRLMLQIMIKVWGNAKCASRFKIKDTRTLHKQSLVYVVIIFIKWSLIS